MTVASGTARVTPAISPPIGILIERRARIVWARPDPRKDTATTSGS